MKFRFEFFDVNGVLVHVTDTSNPELAKGMIDFPAMKGGETVEVTAWATEGSDDEEGHTHEVLPVVRGDVIGHLFRDHGLRSDVLGFKKTGELRDIHRNEHEEQEIRQAERQAEARSGIPRGYAEN